MFEENTFQVILQRLLDRVPDTMDKREGSILYDALAPAAFELQLIYIDLDTFLKEVFTDTASREYLIRRAWERNVTPHEANAAVWKGSFEPKALEIPIGARFNSDDLNFAVRGRLGDGLYELVCETPGSVGNDCIGQIIPIEYISGLQKAELTELLEPGTDEEDTEVLRERYLTILRKPSTSGNIYDYYNWAMSCDGVGAAKIFPLANGPGTVKVVIADENKSEATPGLCRQVKDFIEEQRPIGATVTVTSAVELPINVMGSVKLHSGLNLGEVQTAFQDALAQFLHDSAFELSYVGLARVGNILLETAGVEDYADLTLNGQAHNVALTDEQIATVGTVTLEVMQG